MTFLFNLNFVSNFRKLFTLSNSIFSLTWITRVRRDLTWQFSNFPNYFCHIYLLVQNCYSLFSTRFPGHVWRTAVAKKRLDLINIRTSSKNFEFHLYSEIYTSSVAIIVHAYICLLSVKYCLLGHKHKHNGKLPSKVSLVASICVLCWTFFRRSSHTSK